MTEKILSIIIPSLDEGQNVPDILRKIFSLNLSSLGYSLQVVFVDDGSKDDTEKIIKDFGRRGNKIIYIKHPKPLGKGQSVIDGVRQSSGDCVIIQDADLEYDPADYVLLLSSYLRGEGEAVFGSRFAMRPFSSYIKINFLANYFFTGMVNLFCGSHLTDMWTCYKLLPRDLFLSLNIQSKNFNIEPEITIKCLKRGIKIVEVPISYKPRTIKDGKKIGWRDGFKAIIDIIKFSFFESKK